MARMFNPPHPGRMVAETLEYLGISAREFARHIGVAPSTVTRIIKEKSPITPEMAVRISAAISGPSPEAWLAMQADVRRWGFRNEALFHLILGGNWRCSDRC